MTSALITRIDQLVAQLQQAPDLSPGPETNAIFSELVGLCLGVRGAAATEVLQGLGTSVEEVRRLCTMGESALEQHWSSRIAAADDPHAELKEFTYFDNYRELTRMEVSALYGVGASPRRVAMLGSGPLPLTGLVLASEYGAEVTLVDRDAECLDAGQALVFALGLESQVHSVLAEVPHDALDLTDYDAVLMAAMVGVDAVEKNNCLERIASSMRPGGHLMVRSAAGLRELLYPPADLDDVTGLRPLVEVHPRHEVVNSVVVAEVHHDAAGATGQDAAHQQDSEEHADHHEPAHQSGAASSTLKHHTAVETGAPV